MESFKLSQEPAEKTAAVDEWVDSLSADRVLARRVSWLVLVALTGIYLVSIFYAPSGTPSSNYFTVCPFKNVTGLPCPGCGLSHSFCSIGKGHLEEAFAFNLLGPPLFLFSILIWIRSLSFLKGWNSFVYRFDRITRGIKPLRTFLIGFAVYGAARLIYIVISGSSNLSATPLGRLIDTLFS